MNFSQINFSVFALKIYGILLSIGFLIASLHFYKSLKAENFSEDFFIHHYWRWLLGALLLGRLFAVLLNPEIFEVFGIFSFFAFWEGEVSFYGAALGFVLTMYVDLKKHKKSFWKWADLGVPSFLIGVLIMDLAAFLTGAIYGTETNMPWGIQYETFGVEIINPVHPVTLYAFVFHLILLQWARKLYEPYKKTPGRLFLKFCLFFFLADFFLQFIQGNAVLVLGGLKAGQWVDLLVVLVALWILYARSTIARLKKRSA